MTDSFESRRRAIFNVSQMMAAASKADHDKRVLRDLFDAKQVRALDAWIKRQNDPSLDRIEAIRRLVELGLKAKG